MRREGQESPKQAPYAKVNWAYGTARCRGVSDLGPRLERFGAKGAESGDKLRSLRWPFHQDEQFVRIVHLMVAYIMGVFLIGVHLMGMRRGRASHKRVLWSCT